MTVATEQPEETASNRGAIAKSEPDNVGRRTANDARLRRLNEHQAVDVSLPAIKGATPNESEIKRSEREIDDRERQACS